MNAYGCGYDAGTEVGNIWLRAIGVVPQLTITNASLKIAVARRILQESGHVEYCACKLCQNEYHAIGYNEGVLRVSARVK